MADFVKLDGYNVKDALAGKSLSITGDQLSLLKADGTAASTVTIPAGSKYAILTLSDVGSNIECTYVDSSEVSMSSAYDLIDLIKAGGVAYINYNGNIYAINNYLDGSNPGVSGYTLQAESGGYGYNTFNVSNFSLLNSVWTAITPGGGSSANTNIAFIAQTSGWPTLNTIYGLPGNYKLTNQIGIKATGYGQYGQYETSILASAILINDTYASAEDYLGSNPSQGDNLTIVAWFIANANTIAKVTANCTYDGNGGYTISSASAASATTVGV